MDDIKELIERFISLAQEKAAAERSYKDVQANEIHAKLVEVSGKLDKLGENGKRARLVLLEHPDTAVQYLAAMSVLSEFPKEALETLMRVRDSKDPFYSLLSKTVLSSKWGIPFSR
jgi:hypothetical protein